MLSNIQKEKPHKRQIIIFRYGNMLYVSTRPCLADFRLCPKWFSVCRLQDRPLGNVFPPMWYDRLKGQNLLGVPRSYSKARAEHRCLYTCIPGREERWPWRLDGGAECGWLSWWVLVRAPPKSSLNHRLVSCILYSVILLQSMTPSFSSAIG